MYIKSFQELIVWERAKELSVLTYPISKKINEYSYRDQLNRAVLSISNNIAEGFGRRSKKEFNRFLNISLGSTYEVNSMLLIFKDLKLISEESAIQALELVKNIIALLIGLISKIII
ncbi:four helix bundle protein [Sandaracinomonas limnophila]|uniref:Four helix bundle protein n=1 Tax=Sandaracinomonas limnophila TaxID=1862386 RepID=A0A437PM36_9BACT|nr:four helix bundle protein [Sandaracinomonas limnophila]RVU23361.1 four helix bundle protein [Sandaracinomonas limnophila]